MSLDWRIFIAPGSALFVVPLAVGLGLLLAWRTPGARGAVLRWWTAIAVAAALVAASKIAFYGWGTGIRAWDLTCFSGHTVMALAFWPVALALLVPPASPRARRIAATAGGLLGILTGVSRVPLGAHPPSEVIAGALLGGAVGVYGLWVLRRFHWPRRPVAVLAAACVLAGAWLWASPQPAPTLPSERWFQAAGTALSGRDGPVDRRRWPLAP